MVVSRTRRHRRECKTRRETSAACRPHDASRKRPIHPDHRQSIVASHDGTRNRSPNRFHADGTMEFGFVGHAGERLCRAWLRSETYVAVDCKFGCLPKPMRSTGSGFRDSRLSIPWSQGKAHDGRAVHRYALATHRSSSYSHGCEFPARQGKSGDCEVAIAERKLDMVQRWPGHASPSWRKAIVSQAVRVGQGRRPSRSGHYLRQSIHSLRQRQEVGQWR